MGVVDACMWEWEWEWVGVGVCCACARRHFALYHEAFLVQSFHEHGWGEVALLTHHSVVSEHDGFWF